MLEIGSLILLIILTFLSAFVLSMIGLGGGILFIPIFTLIFHIPVQNAIGLSLFCMTINTLSATIGFWSNKNVNWKLAVAYDVFDIPGIILGAWLTEIIPSIILEIICGIGICTIAILVLLKKKSKQPFSEKKQNLSAENDQITPNSVPINLKFAWTGKNLKWVIFSSFMGGLVTGMVGLGGGTVDTTTMILLGVPEHIAAGSSTLAMFFTNAFGAATHVLLGNILWELALPLGLAVLFAGFLGSRIASRINGYILRKILGVVALISGIRLLLPFI
jgi:uncharacterized membrane protein YfcA